VEESLDDRSLWVRYHGIHAMKTRAKYPNVAIPAWLPSKLLERARLDPAPPVRIAAFEAIADLRIERGIPALIAALADPEPDIASSAAAALGKFNVPESRAALELAIEGDDPQVQRAAIEALGRLRDDTAVDSIRRLAEGTYDSLTRDVAISALAAIGSAASTNALVGLLADRDCRAAASRALAAASGDSLAALIAGLRNPDAGVRCSIVEILGRVKRADVSRTVSRVLEDDVGAVRTAAEQALTRRDLHDVDTAIASAAEADQNSAVRRAASSVVDRS
jgi:HEAT repeat protein